jgi:phage terminase large subunit-like protein
VPRNSSATPYRFDPAKADRVEDFFREFLKHVKGEWAGHPLTLEPWQRQRIIRPIFGSVRRADGLRQYRTAYVEVPVGNGKSTLAAAIALTLLFIDGEPGAEVYGCAGDRDQARIVFGTAKAMVEADPMLMARAEIFKDAITVPSTGSTYRVLSAEAYTKHGLDAHGVIFDELHVQPTRELWDTMVSRVRSRRQPLVFAITTAGYDRHSICYEQYNYAQKVQSGIIEDATFLPVIYEAPQNADWKSKSVWKKANPNYGISLKADYFEKQFKTAQEIPAAENNFRRLHLNQWTEQAVRWLPMDLWDEDAASAPLDLGAFAKQRCFAGLDLSSTSDLASLCLDFPGENGEHRFFWWNFVPQDNARRRAERDRVPYDVWARAGYLILTPGNVIDYDFIRKQINDLAAQFQIAELGYDPWNATQLATQLQGDGLTVVPVRQGFASLNAPSKELEKLVVGKLIRHGGNPVARWCASNVAAAMDPAGNIKPDKARSTEKIDAIVALIIALSRSILYSKVESVYLTRGLQVWGA